jgi:hypothetical protein
MNIYTCSEQSCEIFVENALYFELQKNQICGCVYRFEKLRFSLESCLFRIAKINCIFSWNFYRALEMGICTCIFNFSLFEFHEFFFQKLGSLVLMCQGTFRLWRYYPNTKITQEDRKYLQLGWRGCHDKFFTLTGVFDSTRKALASQNVLCVNY